MAETDAIVGSGGYSYRVVADWAKLPSGWTFRDVAAVAVDAKDRVYVFNRGEHPMMANGIILEDSKMFVTLRP